MTARHILSGAGRSARRLQPPPPSTTPASSWTTTSPSTATSSTARNELPSGGLQALHRARGRHRGRVPPAAPRARRPRGRLVRGHRRRRRESAARARRPRRDRRLEVLAGVTQRRSTPDPATYLGKGKAAELRDIVIVEGVHTVVCDTELAPSQRRALEDVVKVKVIDRTALISRHLRPAREEGWRARPRSSSPSSSTPPRLRGWGVDVPPGRWSGRRRPGHGLARAR